MPDPAGRRPLLTGVAVAIEFHVTPAVGRPGEIIGRASFANRGRQGVELMSLLVESPSLALEVVADSGEPVPLPPPPVPDPAALPAVLRPGQVLDAEYPGFLPAWTPPGSYRVRARLHDARSQWVGVTVTG